MCDALRRYDGTALMLLQLCVFVALPGRPPGAAGATGPDPLLTGHAKTNFVTV